MKNATCGPKSRASSAPSDRASFALAGVPLLVALAMLSGCNPAGDNLAAAPDPSATVPAPRGDYQIGNDDILQIVVYPVADFNRDAQVDGAGNIVLPLLGVIPAAGRTARQLETVIAAKLKAKYIQNPQVTVYVKDAVGQRVTISGSVTKPGVYQVKAGGTLLAMLATAGGFNDTASTTVSIIRTTSAGRQTLAYDSSAIQSGTAADPPVYGGDVISVEDSTAKVGFKQAGSVLGIASLGRVFF